MVFRVIFAVAGGHIHCALFAAPAANQTFAKCDEFLVRRGPEFVALMKAAKDFEFVGVSAEHGIEEASKP